MAASLGILLLGLGIFFLIGIAAGIISLVFAVKKKYRLSQMIFLPLCLLGICVPISFTLGNIIALFAAFLFFIFSLAVVLLYRRK